MKTVIALIAALALITSYAQRVYAAEAVRIASGASLTGDTVSVTVSGGPSCKDVHLSSDAEVKMLPGTDPGFTFEGILVTIYATLDNCATARSMQFYKINGSLKQLVQQALASLPEDKKSLGVRVQLPQIEFQQY